MFLQNKKYIKEILFIIPFKTGKIYTYRNTVYQYISDSNTRSKDKQHPDVVDQNIRMLSITTWGCFKKKHPDVFHSLNMDNVCFKRIWLFT